MNTKIHHSYSYKEWIWKSLNKKRCYRVYLLYCKIYNSPRIRKYLIRIVQEKDSFMDKIWVIYWNSYNHVRITCFYLSSRKKFILYTRLVLCPCVIFNLIDTSAIEMTTWKVCESTCILWYWPLYFPFYCRKNNYAIFAILLLTRVHKESYVV